MFKQVRNRVSVPKNPSRVIVVDFDQYPGALQQIRSLGLNNEALILITGAPNSSKIYENWARNVSSEDLGATRAIFFCGYARVVKEMSDHMITSICTSMIKDNSQLKNSEWLFLSEDKSIEATMYICRALGVRYVNKMESLNLKEVSMTEDSNHGKENYQTILDIMIKKGIIDPNENRRFNLKTPGKIAAVGDMISQYGDILGFPKKYNKLSDVLLEAGYQVNGHDFF